MNVEPTPFFALQQQSNRPSYPHIFFVMAIPRPVPLYWVLALASSSCENGSNNFFLELFAHANTVISNNITSYDMFLIRSWVTADIQSNLSAVLCEFHSIAKKIHQKLLGYAQHPQGHMGSLRFLDVLQT